MGLEMTVILMEIEDVFSIELPDECATLPRAGDFNARILLELSKRDWTRKPGIPEPKWTEEEVWEELRLIISRTILIKSEKIAKETRFVEDLGV